ncbi:multiple sugar transport system substrate-binding protein [Microbacterium sp. cf046]|uniref:ABC transporter substrate-binding protein n=1 Tax=Microbacterium sp. cf046 TaxID=1761803 RepID=UPI0008F3443E|nr:extracellular solute-binding protein [Microbacterium sp. cf046]SFR93080.1 multiple sugar transport system substrate-binding protein [Microbacterium sp. cf046]
MRKVRAGVVVAFTATALILSGCSAGGGETDEKILIWTVEDTAERVEAQQAILDAYSEESGAEIELVAIAEDQLATVLASAAASDQLPDAIGAVSLNALNQLDTDGVVDSEAAQAIVDSLGADTFSPRALELTQNADGAQIGVPSDGWAQLLFYRTDLFDAAGLDTPTTYDTIAEAATTLQSPEVAGIVAATAPADSFTSQTFEHFALANDCQLVDDSGEVTLDSPECVEAIDFYTNLIKDGSVAGNQDADTTRATYFSGGAAMIVWSSFLLDELAGLRNDALPTCPECTDPAFLAENTGIVSAIEGPDGSEPASFGEIVSWSVMTGASEGTQDLIEYMMDGGYSDWLAIAPEGKIPTRLGTADEPATFTDAWKGLEVGVDTKALLSDIYGEEVLAGLVEAPNSFNRWGLPQGQGALAGAVGGQFVLPGVLSETINSGLSAEDGAKQAAEQANAIKGDLGL